MNVWTKSIFLKLSILFLVSSHALSYQLISPKEHILKYLGSYYSARSGYSQIDDEIFSCNRIVAKFYTNVLTFDEIYFFCVKSKQDIQAIVEWIQFPVYSIKLYKQLNYGGLKVDSSQVAKKKKGFWSFLLQKKLSGV